MEVKAARTRHKLCANLTLLSALLLGIGFTAPALKIVPGFGELAPILSVFTPNMGRPREITILPGIFTLIEDGHVFIGLLLLGFSVVFPLWKLGVLWVTYRQELQGAEGSSMLNFVSKLGKYSMLDVLFLALVVIIIKGLPGGTSVEIGWGMLVFAVAVVLSLVIPAIHRS